MADQCVLIVGAGPTGLTLARQLHRQGITPTIIDKSAGPATQSRALAVQARTLEVLGPHLAGRLLQRGQPLRRAEIFAGADKLAALDLSGSPTPYSFALGISQSIVEEVLIEDLEHRGVAVGRESTLTALEQRSDSVAVTYQRAGEEPVTEEFSWVVGADGVHSAVREAAGIQVTGSGDDRWWLLADVTLSGPGVPAHDTGRVFLNRDGVLAYLPLEGDWWRIIATGSTDPERPDLTIADFDGLNGRSPIAVGIDTHRWISAFRIREHVADTYRAGCVLIAGDAAHAHSPLGGQGMNTGMQDAVNLAWKLALVMHSAAEPTLLDTYESERRPIAQALVASTGRGTRAMLASSAWAVWLRNRAIESVLSLEGVSARARLAVEMLSVSYENSPLTSQFVGRGLNDEAPDRARTRQLADELRAGQPVRVTEPRAAELIDRPNHLLLLFDGDDTTPEGYARIRQQIAVLGDDPYLDIFVVVRDESALDPIREHAGRVLVDRDGQLSRTFAGQTECAVVVRPDGYVGYRSDPIEPALLVRWWRGVRTANADQLGQAWDGTAAGSSSTAGP